MRFLTKDRTQFAQACRYCEDVRIGKIVMGRGDDKPLVVWSDDKRHSTSQSDIERANPQPDQRIFDETRLKDPPPA